MKIIQKISKISQIFLNYLNNSKIMPKLHLFSEISLKNWPITPFTFSQPKTFNNRPPLHHVLAKTLETRVSVQQEIPPLLLNRGT